MAMSMHVKNTGRQRVNSLAVVQLVSI